ncbi:DNA methylase N-4/N-6 domain-containing protein [Mycolicibacterium mageritense DSM 44476 = CIP 104973]|uniref:DNA methylase N-4/N-6 domain-containing protein n=1 Tax=Mycolicibacterium mageritense TaxID=53462 RepID=A0ABM7HJT2_MYCME|nr:DNA methyltransferase [Mycolicibacterium mageritense]BBX30739.1 hypothetical protein MMAGJ_00210 [Mycolicibacterium mageritense]BBX35947.1 hypothetical protein MMAGJ_52290 [Mycolicibacterium mageritense]CDO24071.1 adenine specific DNA methylase Mod [Mycolicibacterium mageritense DSM 44476 = CIP 104973]
MSDEPSAAVPAPRATNLIDSLLSRVRDNDPSLADDLRRAIKSVTADREFGLVFNRHLPETVELPGRAVRVLDKVRIKDDEGGRTWRVNKVRRAKGGRVAEIVSADTDALRDNQPLDNLVVIADFRDPIYPGLKSTGDRIERGGEKPFHTVINAENAHALEALSFTHAGKVDCIYIDPPYNTRANDWKYNNDFVDPKDTYSHSKWLAFMKRRLELAKKLLDPDDSVLIVTIDEKEVHRLGLLLEQTFPQARIQMVSSVINPKGVSRGAEFRRTDEYIFYAMLGAAAPTRLLLGPEWSSSAAGTEDVSAEDVDTEPELQTPEWTSMMRRGSNAARADRPSMFYPIYADPSIPKIVDVGDALPAGVHEAPTRKGLVAILPLRRNGKEGRWQISAGELRTRIEQGRVRLGRPTTYGFVVNYLPDGAYEAVMSDQFEVTGRAEDGSLIAVGRRDGRRIAPTQWKLRAHNASEHGSTLLSSFLPGRSFPFPKSLYAVEDCLRFFLKDKPDAVILDFFAGSGTTAHAVMRLNRQDNGWRQSISITNNEVSADEQKKLREEGRYPGDAAWEAWGICEYITKPRIKAAVTGRTPEGETIKGNYKFTDEFPMSEGFEENVEFFTLTYEDAEAVRLDLAFTAVAPMLWLRAGGQGSRIDTRTDTFAVADHYGVLFDPDHWRGFVRSLEKVEVLRCVYVVTDDDALFQRVTSKLPDEVNGHRLDVVRLYENYLNNFEINTTRV